MKRKAREEGTEKISPATTIYLNKQWNTYAYMFGCFLPFLRIL